MHGDVFIDYNIIFRKFFMNLRTNLHLRMFPHFLYPLHHTSITGSIFMTVALAFERYSALNYPMEYNRVSTYIYIQVRGLPYSMNVDPFLDILNPPL